MRAASNTKSSLQSSILPFYCLFLTSVTRNTEIRRTRLLCLRATMFNDELSARQYVHTHTHMYRLHMICLQWSECLMIFGLFVEEEVQAVCRPTSF